jgi:hypothetical protein
MTKLSNLPVETTFGANDYLVKVKTAGAGDVLVKQSDFLNAIGGGAWQAYTPVLTGAVTNPNIGSTGTITGRYTQIGKTVFYECQITVSGTGITTGSGLYSVSLPVAANTTFDTGNAAKLIGQIAAYEQSSGVTYLGSAQLTTSTTALMLLWWIDNNAGLLLQAIGGASDGVYSVRTGNVTTITGTYEAA